MSQQGAFGKTMMRRIEQYRDRWSSYGLNTGIVDISDKLSPEELKKIEIFEGYPDKFLERISTDVSVATWKQDSVLFEEGTYIDLAFFLLEGKVEVSLQKGQAGAPAHMPIFEDASTLSGSKDKTRQTNRGTKMVDISQLDFSTGKVDKSTLKTRKPEKNITFLAAMDFNLPKDKAAVLGPGEFFGEIGALSGWPQSVTVKTLTECTLVQIRVPALRLMKQKSSALKQRIDAIYKERSLFSQLKSTPLFSHCDDMIIEGLTDTVDLVSCQPDEVVVGEGDAFDSFFVVRSGFIKLTQRFGEDDLVVSYLSKGMTLGEVELLVEGVDRWESTATSVEYAELIKIPASAFHSILADHPEMEEQLWETAATRIKESGYSKRNMNRSAFTRIALETGLVQGNSILVLDLDLCTRCDDCVRACAATHQGRPRFIREGNKLGNLLIPKSCYHCRDPVCLVGCPTGAIHRAGVGEVVAIDDDICIGCSTCANNCPYDAIVMHETGDVWPGDMVPVGLRGQKRSVASKCDLCYSTGHEPACVTNCPQGCATRVGSVESLRKLSSKGV